MGWVLGYLSGSEAAWSSLHYCGSIRTRGMSPRCLDHWAVQSDMLSWTLELAVMLELRPRVDWKVKKHSSWIVWSYNPEREATSCFCWLAFIYFEMWGSVLLYNWLFYLMPLWMLSLSVGKSNLIKIVAGFFFCFWTVKAPPCVSLLWLQRLWFGKASSWVVPASKKLHLHSVSKCPGSLLPELQALEMKMRDPSVHSYPYIQPTCFIAYCPLVPVTKLSSLSFPLASFLFTPYRAPLQRELLLLWLAIKSVLL